MRAARRSDGCACAWSRRGCPSTTASCPTRPATRSLPRPRSRSTARWRGSKSTPPSATPARPEPSEEDELGQHHTDRHTRRKHPERDLAGRLEASPHPALLSARHLLLALRIQRRHLLLGRRRHRLDTLLALPLQPPCRPPPP